MCGCSNNKKTQAARARARQGALPTDDNFKEVVYRGAYGGHIVRSPTNVLEQYNRKNYGTSTHGRTLFVHIDDIAAAPDKFVLVENEPTTS